jgi:pyridoxamine 5'-phosphate oxidase-like protein
MLSWEEFAVAQPEMARFGEERLKFRVMYLASLKADGYPRIHPFTPFTGSGHLYAFMESTSPKAKDLQRNGKYAMHSLVTDGDGTNGEFQISGQAVLQTDSATRDAAVRSCPFKPKERYILFEFKLNSCLTNYYTNGIPNVKRWKEATETV